eukprot:11184945-Lingulodinium_polyedra.AAC.1
MSPIPTGRPRAWPPPDTTPPSTLLWPMQMGRTSTQLPMPNSVGALARQRSPKTLHANRTLCNEGPYSNHA